jgi:ABC-2 type transport system permease protein
LQGRKERKTVEALLATPLSDMELLFGKTLISFIPTMIVTFLSFSIYAGITDYLDYPMFGYAILPNSLWVVILFGIAPAFAIAATGLTVIISTRVSGTREAQQLDTLVAVLAIMIAVDYVILRLGVGLFNRERILSKL